MKRRRRGRRIGATRKLVVPVLWLTAAGPAPASASDARPAFDSFPVITVSAAPEAPVDAADMRTALLNAGPFPGFAPGADYQLDFAANDPGGSGPGACPGVTVTLRWRGRDLDEYRYDPRPCHHGGPASRGLAPDLATRLARDLAHRNAFSTGRLHDGLQTSDYASGLILPAVIVGFERQRLQVFHDPLQGAHVRYRGADTGAGHIDVFVYPVRARRWEGGSRLLDAELQAAGQDLEALQARGLLNALTLARIEAVELGRAGSATTARRFIGEFADAQYQPFDIYGYAMIREDKFVKVLATVARHAGAETDIDGFVSALAAAINVPSESPFMARTRANGSVSR